MRALALEISWQLPNLTPSMRCTFSEPRPQAQPLLEAIQQLQKANKEQKEQLDAMQAKQNAIQAKQCACTVM